MMSVFQACAFRYMQNYNPLGRCASLLNNLDPDREIRQCEDDGRDNEGTSYCQAGASALVTRVRFSLSFWKSWASSWSWLCINCSLRFIYKQKMLPIGQIKFFFRKWIISPLKKWKKPIMNPKINCLLPPCLLCPFWK